MRVVVLVALFATVAAAAATAGTPVALCGSAEGTVSRPAPTDRVVLGTVALPGARLDGVVPAGTAQPRRWWHKGGLELRGGTIATIRVAQRDRSIATVTWGGITGSTLRFVGCEGPRWSAYAGGFFIAQRRACVTLDVTVGARTRAVRFGFDRAC